MKKILCVLLCLSMLICLCACSNKDDGTSDFVCIEVRDMGNIKLQLYANTAPITVENFKKLVSEKFYDGIIFHRVIKDFMIQAGDPAGTGMGGADQTIKGEFAVNGFNNTLSHERGVISMARNSQSYDSAGSQFFIVQKDSTYLDGQYAAFGRVIEGMDVVDKIAECDTDEHDKPTSEIVIERAYFVEK